MGSYPTTLYGALRIPREILFGKGQRAALGTVAARLGRRALICTDERFAKTTFFARMMEDLAAASIEIHIHDQILPDVPRDTVAACVEQVEHFAPDMVIGIGGGSCLDFAKCSALLLTHGGKLQDYYGEFKVPGPVLQIISVPTTAGTGSEVTPVAVISDPDRTLKVGISSPYLISTAAICDPELTFTCPPRLTAIAGADALTHAVEAFTAGTREPGYQLAQQHVFVGKSAFTDHFALLAIRLLGQSLVTAVNDGSNEDARADVMMAAMAAGCAFGTAGTAAAHAVQYPVGSLTHTAHGLGVATLLPYVMTHNRAYCEPELAEIASALGLPATATAGGNAQGAIDEIIRIFAAIKIPRTLAELGLAADQVEWTAQQAIGIERLIKNNPRPMDLASMTRLVQAAFDDDLAAAAA